MNSVSTFIITCITEVHIYNLLLTHMPTFEKPVGPS